MLRATLSLAVLIVSVCTSQAQDLRPSQIRLGSVPSNGPASLRGTAHAVPPRFLGWHYAAAVPGGAGRWARPSSTNGNTPAANHQASLSRDLKAGAALSFPAAGNTPATVAGFQVPPSLPAGYLPTAVAQGDFNEDGKMDLAISNGGDNTIYVLLGNGDGTFALPEVLYTKGQSPVWLTAAKLRNSGHTDLIAVDADTNTVEVFTGAGDGTFGPGATVATPPASPSYVLAADFDGDGNLDLAIGLTVPAYGVGPAFTVLYGDGSGAFPASVVSSTVDNSDDGSPLPLYNLTAIDLNKDGHPDLVASFYLGSAISYLAAPNGRTFNAAAQFGAPNGTAAIGLGDLNGDGCPDAVEADTLGLLYIANGACDGTFGTGKLVAEAGDIAASIAVRDVNADGVPDVVISSAWTEGALVGGTGAYGGYLVSVLKGDGKGGLLPAAMYRVGSQAYALLLPDLNGSGYPDIVTLSGVEGTATLLRNDGAGGFGVPSGETIGYIGGGTNAPLPSSPPPQTLDLNGDGKPDVVLMEYGFNSSQSAQITALLNDGTGNLGQPIRSPISIGSNDPYPLFVAGSFRKSAGPDLIYVSQYFSPNQAAFFPGMGNGSFGAPVVLATLPGPSVLVSGDFNNDGKLDFATFGTPGSTSGPQAQGQLDVFLGNGDGTFNHLPAAVFTVSSTSTPQQLIVADFNHDGKPDLLIGFNANGGFLSSGDDLDLALGNGDGTFQAPSLLLAHFGPVAVADLNHDGYPDLIQIHDSNPDLVSTALAAAGGPELAPVVTIYLGSAGAHFTQSASYLAPGVQSPSLAPPLVGDFNGDGQLDIALPVLPSGIGRPWEHQLAIFQGVGDGTFLPVGIPYQLPAYDLPVAGGDYRGTGRTDLLDLVGATSSLNTISAVGAPALSLAPNPAGIVNGAGSAIVTLALPSSASQTVSLSSSDPAVTLPATLTFAPGQTEQAVSFTASSALDTKHLLAVTGQLNGGTATALFFTPSSNTQTGVSASIGPSLPGITAASLTPGQAVPLVFNLQSLGGYTGTFGQFSCAGLPAGLSCNFASSTVRLLPGDFAEIAFSITASSSASLGSYKVTVQAKDGQTSGQASLTLGVGGFTLSSSAPYVVFNGSSAPTTQVTATFLDGLNASVTFTCAGLPSGVSCDIPGIVYPGSPTTGITPLLSSTVTVAPGAYTFQITGTAGNVSQTLNETLYVGGYTAALDKTTATMPNASSTTFNVTLTSIDHFVSEHITLACGQVATISCTFLPAVVSLADDATATTQVTVSYNSALARNSPPTWPERRAPLGGISILACTLLYLKPWRRSRPRLGGLVLLVLSLASFLPFAGCSGSGSSAGSGGGYPPLTKQVQVPITVTASTYTGSLTQNVGTLTLTVTP